MTKHFSPAGHIGTGFNPVSALVGGVLPNGVSLMNPSRSKDMTKHISTTGQIGTGFNPLAALIDGVLHTGATLATWQQRAHERAHLDGLDDRLLRDAGIDPYAAKKEAKKPFWKR